MCCQCWNIIVHNISPVEAAGKLIPSVTTDFDGDLRSAFTPNDIGADAGNYLPLDDDPMSISYIPIPNGSILTTINFSNVAVSDSDGVQVSGNLKPRVYYKKRSDANVFNDNTGSTTGWKYSSANNSASPFSFTIDYSKLYTAVSLNDTIVYFVAAQDLSPVPYIFSNTVSFASYPSSIELTSSAFPVTGIPSSFKISGNPLSGDYTVGLSLFNQVSGDNITFEKITEKVMSEIIVTKVEELNLPLRTELMEVEEDSYIPMSNGIVYAGLLGLKRKDNPEISSSAMAGVYATITAAINDLKAYGASGPVRFLLLDNSYTSESLPISVTPWTGASQINTLTIKPAAGVTSMISGSHGLTLFNLNNCDNVTIDGSNSEGGISKDLTIRNSSSYAIQFVNDATKNIVKNCILKSSSTVVSFAGTSGTSGNDSNTVQNNDITASAVAMQWGVYNYGSVTGSAQKNSGNQIIGNRIFNFFHRGITDFGFSAGNVYRGNEIFQTIVQSGSLTGAQIGVTDVASLEGFVFDRNKIYNLTTSGPGAWGLAVEDLQAGHTGVITNNFISMKSDEHKFGVGIIDRSASNLQMYINSIITSGNVTGDASSVTYMRLSTSTFHMKNNILVNKTSGGTGSHYVIWCYLPLGTSTSDYNDIFNTAGSIFAYDGVGNRNNLTQWQTATGLDSHSISAEPFFVNDPDLHIDSTQTSPVSNAGIPVAGVTFDIDNQMRSLTSPDIGADEFGAVNNTSMLDLKVLIEGFYNSASNLMISDSIKVYLRSNSSPYTIIDSAESVASDSGMAHMAFANTVSGSYFIEVIHRNSIETWSDNAVTMTQGGTVNYNFTTAASQAFGNNMKQVDSSPTRFAIYSGDVNQDGVVDGTDASVIDNDAFNFVKGYVAGDVNGDEIVDGSDAAVVDNNAANFVGKITP